MKKIVLAMMLWLAVMYLQAQNFTRTDVAKIQLRNSGAIIQDQQVKGYYFFYMLEKKDKKNSHYALSVVDENLREINTIDIVKPIKYALLDGAFNGETFAFMFYDPKKKAVEFVGYDRTLKQTGSATRVIKGVYALTTFTNITNHRAPEQPFLVPVSGKGFLYYGYKDGKKIQFETEFYDNNLKKLWSNKSAEKARSFELAEEGFQSKDYVGSMIVGKTSANSKDIDMDLIVQKVTTGEVLFRVPMVTSKYSVSFSEVFYDSTKANFVVFGEYYEKSAKELKAQSLGFIYLTLDMNGKIIGEKVNSWATEISKVTPMNEKGKVEGSNTNVLIHDIIRTDDGQIFAIGEQYKKAASGSGIAMQALAIGLGAATGANTYSTASSTQLNVYDMVVFQFDSDYSIRKMHMFPKSKNEVMLPAGSTYVSAKLLSYYAKAIGGFDFLFTQQPLDKSTFAMSYINYDRKKGEKASNVLGTVVYTPEKTFATDKVKLNRKSTDYFVFRAKDGYVLIYEYFKKEKKIEARLEKINY